MLKLFCTLFCVVFFMGKYNGILAVFNHFSFDSQLDCFQTILHCTFPSKYRYVCIKHMDVERYTCVYTHMHTSHMHPIFAFFSLVFGPIASVCTGQVPALGSTVLGVWLWSLQSWTRLPAVHPPTWGSFSLFLQDCGIVGRKLQKQHNSDSACSACTSWDAALCSLVDALVESMETLLYPFFQFPSPTVPLKWWMHHSCAGLGTFTKKIPSQLVSAEAVAPYQAAQATPASCPVPLPDQNCSPTWVTWVPACRCSAPPQRQSAPPFALRSSSILGSSGTVPASDTPSPRIPSV